MPIAPPEIGPRASVEDWTTSLRSAIRDLDELLDYVELERTDLVEDAIIDPTFPLLVPRGFAARMRKRAPRDPLLRQVLPIAEEQKRVAGFVRDPLDEVKRSRDGVMHKYAGRALLVTTAACPVHCRYCFRRHFPYENQTALKGSWRPTIEALAGADDIREVILSGGDPLTLPNRRLEELIEAFDTLDHIKTVRIHTRYPIVLPERIDTDLLSLLARCRLHVVVVVHCNHAQEIDTSVERALDGLRAHRVVLLNQSVLLRGVNDDFETLAALSHKLFEVGVLPYYLHTLDPVDGSAHFDVPRRRALALVASLRKALPGYLVPRLAKEVPGEMSKTILS